MTWNSNYKNSLMCFYDPSNTSNGTFCFILHQDGFKKKDKNSWNNSKWRKTIQRHVQGVETFKSIKDIFKIKAATSQLNNFSSFAVLYAPFFINNNFLVNKQEKFL